MAAKRVYTNDERASAVAAISANDGNIYKTSKELGIPAQTLRQWAKGTKQPDALVESESKKAPLADMFETFVYRTLGLTDDADIKKSPLHQRMTAAGIAVDKMNVLRGLPSAITGQANSRDFNLERIRELLARLAGDDGGSGNPRIAGPSGNGSAGEGSPALPG